ALPSEGVVLPAPDREAFHLTRWRDLAIVEHRGVEQLEGDVHLAAVAHEQGQTSRESPARADSPDADAVRVDAELLGVVEGPPLPGRAVLERTREGGLGGKPVVDRHTDKTERWAPVVERSVVHVVGTDGVPTAVDAVQARQQSLGALGAVAAHRDRRIAGD